MLYVKIPDMETGSVCGAEMIGGLLESWQLAMRAERKRDGTIKTYRDGVKAFLKWCADTGTEAELTKPKVQAFVTYLLDNGAEPATAHGRHKAVKRFATWLTDEGELDTNPLLGSRSPKLDSKLVEALTDAELTALMNACKGKNFKDIRDTAIVRLMAETGARASEVIGMTVADVQLREGVALIRRGKGGKGRMVPISPQCAAAIDKYLRARQKHRLAGTAPLWLGGGGKTFGYHGLYEGLKARGAQAGLPPTFSPHKLRNTTARRWLDAGGSEQGLMAVAGWTSRSMLDRYTRASASQRAAEEARRLALEKGLADF